MGGLIGEQRWSEEAESQFCRAARDSWDIWTEAMHQGFQGLVDEGGGVVQGASRLVAKGFLQKEGVTFLETFLPTPVPSSIRIIAVIALQCDWSLSHWDIELAFVQSGIDHNIFMRMPASCDALSGIIAKLTKSLNGLKQSPRVFNKLLISYFLAFGLVGGKSDPSILRSTSLEVNGL